MASIGRDPNGRKRILFVAPDGKRKTIRLGKVSQNAAQTVKLRVEKLLAVQVTGDSVDLDTARWLADREPELLDKLARVGLIPDRIKPPALEAFLNTWHDARKGDYKPASLLAWQQVIDALVRFLGSGCLLKDVTPERAESFRQSMLTSGLRATTIHKRLQHARLFFKHAKRQGHIDANPFEFVRHRPGDASERRAYVLASGIERAIEFAPNATWKLLIALSRFAGLRVPSEALSLKWQDIDWERLRITVPSPKTQHLAGRGHRVIPLFPEVRPFLEQAWDECPEGSEYVIPEEYRRRAKGPGGWANANLRTTLEKILRRAGVDPWPRLWHSMRASCETDLARKFPLAIVAKWLGNTQAVAMRHYVDVTDADFERAVSGSAAQNPAQQAHASDRTEDQEERVSHKKSPEIQEIASSCNSLQTGQVEAAGIEPACRDISMQASTCVFDLLRFRQAGLQSTGFPKG